jgi:catechol 2,3-dioxygenase-like lactoylglutathione lyase family enzyme
MSFFGAGAIGEVIRCHKTYALLMRQGAHSGFDHVTIAVMDLDEAKRFFALLGFEEGQATVVSGEQMSRYMGIPNWEADHVTLVLAGATTHQEVQLLRFHHPALPENPSESNLARLGFNHVCFAVNDLDETLGRLKRAGIETRNEVMDFHDRRLVFLAGPGGVTIELAEWVPSESG